MPAIQVMSSFETHAYWSEILTLRWFFSVQLHTFWFFSCGGVLDALSPTAILWLPMVPSTHAKIPSRSCPPHDPADDRFLPAYDRELNGLGGVYYLPGLMGARGVISLALRGLFLANS